MEIQPLAHDILYSELREHFWSWSSFHRQYRGGSCQGALLRVFSSWPCLPYSFHSWDSCIWLVRWLHCSLISVHPKHCSDLEGWELLYFWHKRQKRWAMKKPSDRKINAKKKSIPTDTCQCEYTLQALPSTRETLHKLSWDQFIERKWIDINWWSMETPPPDHGA